eukprot:snap_masked-scaffold_81-processed-gene-0.2-mRNA-1 protein AED:1.00 eAED:1.00 QI:0/-1/0/0/-1/1/1/0/180
MVKARSNRENSRDSNMKALAQYGHRCQAKDGESARYFNRSSYGKVQLRGVTFQEPAQKQPASICSCCIQIDTTQDISRYRILAIMPVDVDCFFRFSFFGCSFMETENRMDEVKGLRFIGLTGAKLIMSDGSRSLAITARELHSAHFQSLNHFLASLSSCCRPLSGKDLSHFSASINKILC